jgi:hypothetical protein
MTGRYRRTPTTTAAGDITKASVIHRLVLLLSWKSACKTSCSGQAEVAALSLAAEAARVGSDWFALRAIPYRSLMDPSRWPTSSPCCSRICISPPASTSRTENHHQPPLPYFVLYAPLDPQNVCVRVNAAQLASAAVRWHVRRGRCLYVCRTCGPKWVPSHTPRPAGELFGVNVRARGPSVALGASSAGTGTFRSETTSGWSGNDLCPFGGAS